MDKASSFKTKCILCMPIKNATGSVIGVAQLVNKLDGTQFNKNDENLFEVGFYCHSNRAFTLGKPREKING